VAAILAASPRAGRVLRWALGAALGLQAAGCWAPLSQGRSLEARLDRLEQEGTSAAARRSREDAARETELRRLEDDLDRMRARLAELGPLQAQVGTSLGREQAALEEQIRLLHASLDAQATRVAALEATASALRDDVDARFSALAGVGALDQWAARKQVDGMKLPTDDAGMVARGLEEERAGDRAVAAEIFRRALRRFPADPRSAEARFQLAEMDYGAGRYDTAVAGYRRLLQDFPRSDLAPDALYREGEALLALGLRADARDTFREVRHRFPGTTAALRARDRLQGVAAPKRRMFPRS
jgi:TolA-binding protein